MSNLVILDDVVKEFKFTRRANYSVHVGWDYIERWVTDHEKSTPVILDPDYQRGHVWTRKQQIKYIEYIMRGGISAKELFFNCSSWMRNFNTPLEIVDGKQRLTAVLKYMNNEFPAFSHYVRDFRRVGDPCNFIVTINDLKTRKEVLQWYLDLNTSGTPHTNKELSKVRDLIENEAKL